VTPEDLDPNRAEGELSPEDDDTVRRLLAAAAPPMTMPDDVVGRLDAVLAGLQAERETAGVTAETVVPERPDVSELGQRRAQRRARRWPKILVAAAAVGVVGVGLGNILTDTSGDSMSARTTADSQAEAGADVGGLEDAPQPESGRDLILPDGQATKSARDPRSSAALVGAAVPTAVLPRVRPEAAKEDAQRIYDLSQRRAAPFNTARDGVAMDSDGAVCDLPPIKHGERLVAVRLGAERATLLFRGEEDGSRQAEVYSCADGDSPVLVSTVDVP